jgi:periplasmic divalent cation tolerance protein
MSASLDGEPSAAARIVLITAPDPEVARALARSLVSSRLAACVNVIPGLTSVYRWEGAVQEDTEALLIVKTRVDRLPELTERVAHEHPYDVPELVALRPDRVEPRYLRWLLEACPAAPGGRGA